MRLSSTDMLNFVQTDNPPPAQAGLSVSTKKHDVPEELLSGLLANYKKSSPDFRPVPDFHRGHPLVLFLVLL